MSQSYASRWMMGKMGDGKQRLQRRLFVKNTVKIEYRKKYRIYIL